MNTPAFDGDRLRRAFVDLAGEAATPPEDCPEPDRLWWAVRGELPPAAARTLVLHTAACPACAESWRLALELRTDAGSASSIGPRARWWGSGLPFAAGLAAMVLAGGLVRQQEGAAGPGGHASRERGGVRAVMAEDSPLPRAACVLRWTPAGEGARYDLRVATAALEVIHGARNLSEPEAQVPPSVLAALPPGTRLLWQVEVVATDGTRTASPTFMVRLE
jgi:hypothetical protein